MKMNKKMAKVLGYDDNSAMVNFGDFGIFKQVITRSWVTYYAQLLNFLVNKEMKKFQWDRDLLFLINNKGKKINGDLIFYKRIYYDNNELKGMIYIT